MATILGELLTLFGLLAMFVGIPVFMVWRERGRGGAPGVGSVETPPPDQGWTDELGSDGRRLYARSYDFNEALAEQDARARRGEFYQGD